MGELLRRIRFLFERGRYERELDEEMRHHLAMLQEDGRAPSDAHRQFGNVTFAKEESRSMWSFAVVEQLAQDLRYAARTMAASPLFTATAVLSLALGIGANTAIYSFLNAILMRTLPVPQPEELAILEWHGPKRPNVAARINGTIDHYKDGGIVSPNFPYSTLALFRGEKDLFSTVFAYTFARNFNVIVNGEAESIPGSFVSGNYFSGLGVPPAAGRLMVEDDDRSGAPAMVVLAHSYWQRRFHGDAGAVGQQILVNGLPYTIAGVAAPGFFGVDPQSNPQFYLPVHAMPAFSPRPADEERMRFLDDHLYWLEMMGRLRPGVSMQQAQSVLHEKFRTFAASTALSPRDAEMLPELTLDEGASGLDSLRRQYSKPLYVLMTMVALILAIACANLANLLLARAAARRREIAVRLSLGAGRGRIVRQMLTESVLLSIVGGFLGLAVASAGIRFITWLIANGRPDFTLRAELDWPVLAFTFAVAVTAGVLFGVAPALQATRGDFNPALKENRLQGWSAPWRRWRPRLTQVLIVGQMGVSLLLVIGAGLFVRTLSNLHSIDIGFNRENILLVNLNGRQAGYRDAALARFYGGLLDRFREIPGVRSASASDFPLVSRYVNDSGVIIPGRATTPAIQIANMLDVEPAFLETMQIPVIMGRGLQPRDLASPAVAVVNDRFAENFFPGENPIGRQFQFRGSSGPLLEIVGVVRGANYNSLQEKRQPVAYLPYTYQVSDMGGIWFEIRTAGAPTAIAGEVRRIVHQASTAVSVAEITTQEQRIEQTISQERTFAQLGSCFAGLALVIACVGLYGAMSYTVARRTAEIGIRMALGAQRGGIVRMVLRDVLLMTAVGLAIGYAGARMTTRFLESFLFGMKANDPLAIAGAMAILLAAAMAAGYLPAWRASRIDPATALRSE